MMLKADNNDGTDDAALRVPACDACKTRKIKCDRNTPCSSCIASKIPCRTTKRAPEKRQRVHLSAKYGDELADVNRKLSSLTDAVQSILKRQDEVKGFSPDQRSSTELLSTPSEPPTDEGVPYEGDSSFTAQSKSITQALEATISQSALRLDNAVQKLVQEAAMVHTINPITTPTTSSGSGFKNYPELSHLVLPPMAVVLRVLRVVKDTSHRFFAECPLEDAHSFADLCQKIYFPADDYSLASWVIVNCGLFYLFRDSDQSQRKAMELDTTQINQYSTLCDSNITAAVQRMRLLIEPTVENMEALVLAGSVCMEQVKTPIAWKLIAAATRLCLDSGLHQLESTATDPDSRKKRCLFWYLFAMERGLALSFGRVPNIPDYDIAIPRPLPTDIVGVWGQFFGTWLECAALQGDIYISLFSTSAKRESQDVRTERARQLASRLEQITFNARNMDLEALQFQGAMAEASMCVDIIVYSLLTLILRNIPPDQPGHPLRFNSECVTAARHALRRLNDAWNDIRKKDDYAFRMFVNWTLVFIPFIPYIVVFGNTIIECNHDDLRLLGAIVDTIKVATVDTPVYNKLSCACEKFYEIAQAYVAANTQRTGPSMGITTPKVPENAFTPPGMSDLVAQQDWNSLLNEWDLGLGAESAREMSSYFEQYMDAR